MRGLPTAATSSDVASLAAEMLEAHRFNISSESELHVALRSLFEQGGFEPRSEVVLSGADRIDFLLRLGVGVEVKVKGSAAEIARQLQRYAGHDVIRELTLVTTLRRHQSLEGATFHGKRVRVVRLVGGFL